MPLLALLLPVLALAQPSLQVKGGKIDVAFEDFPRAASNADVLAFIKRSAEPVSAYYGSFPVPKLHVDVILHHRNEKGMFGREFHGSHISFFLGPKVRAGRLRDDQILTHEMFHLGFPDLARDYAWVEEGLATYLAHLGRARVGQTSEKKFWADAREGFGDAMEPGRKTGLADEDDYHRMYWGGALLWFEIDLEIREKSAGARCLDTVTRAILAAGGDNAHKWTLEQLEAAVDKAAGFPVFRKWYDYFGPKPAQPDLPALWKRLGVVADGKSVKLDNSAPDAGLRQGMLKNLP